MGVVNSSLGNWLRSLVGEHSLRWEFVIPQAESAYNSFNPSTQKPAFEIAYGQNTHKVLDCLPFQTQVKMSMETKEFTARILNPFMLKFVKTWNNHHIFTSLMLMAIGGKRSLKRETWSWFTWEKKDFQLKLTTSLNKRSLGLIILWRSWDQMPIDWSCKMISMISPVFHVSDLYSYNGSTDKISWPKWIFS